MITIKKIIKNNLWVSAIMAVIITFFVIPIFLMLRKTNYEEEPKGVYIRSGNRVFYNFLQDIKRKDDVLILGTSETGYSLSGNNYYALLNRDKEQSRHFYSLGGAGRTNLVYFPLILNNPEAFTNLNVIYYVNPTYWSKGMNRFVLEYFDRYVDSSLVYATKLKAIESGVYKEYMRPIDAKGNITKIKIKRRIDDFRSFFYYDLKQLFEEDIKKHNIKIDLNNYWDAGKRERLEKETNMEYNASYAFLKHKAPFPAVDIKSSFQYDQLLTFINMNNKYNINCTFYLGPFNEIYCQKNNPELVEDYWKTVFRIKELLLKHNLKVIDGSGLSKIPGTFYDIQHISEYGAYLTALLIKKNYEKAN